MAKKEAPPEVVVDPKYVQTPYIFIDPPPRYQLPAAVVLPPDAPTHLEMEAPFVYRAGNPDQELDYVAARTAADVGCGAS